MKSILTFLIFFAMLFAITWQMINHESNLTILVLWFVCILYNIRDKIKK